MDFYACTSAHVSTALTTRRYFYLLQLFSEERKEDRNLRRELSFYILTFQLLYLCRLLYYTAWTVICGGFELSKQPFTIRSRPLSVSYPIDLASQIGARRNTILYCIVSPPSQTIALSLYSFQIVLNRFNQQNLVVKSRFGTYRRTRQNKHLESRSSCCKCTHSPSINTDKICR